MGVNEILEDGLMDSGYWILNCGEGPSPPGGEGARGRAGRCFRGMVLVPAGERPSRYAAVVLCNSRSVVSKSMCLSTDAVLVQPGRSASSRLNLSPEDHSLSPALQSVCTTQDKRSPAK